ncbi:hypothetical protein CQ012_15360 [Arthrobacter sp. MYb214]|nr:hypothetical protein CQ012_15360 [Arthrobacter sp. MYb214]
MTTLSSVLAQSVIPNYLQISLLTAQLITEKYIFSAARDCQCGKMPRETMMPWQPLHFDPFPQMEAMQ